MRKYPKNHKAVDYHVPGRKRRIASSTTAISDLLTIFHQDNPTLTIRQLRELLSDRTRYIYNHDAIEVIDAHIKAGYGDYIPT